MKSYKSLCFYDSNSDVVMVIHKVENHWTYSDLENFVHSLPSEIRERISYVDGVERIELNETEDLLN